jgi:hypothetical protein
VATVKVYVTVEGITYSGLSLEQDSSIKKTENQKKYRYTEIVFILLSFSTTSYEQNKALNLYSNR